MAGCEYHKELHFVNLHGIKPSENKNNLMVHYNFCQVKNQQHQKYSSKKIINKKKKLCQQFKTKIRKLSTIESINIEFLTNTLILPYIQ